MALLAHLYSHIRGSQEDIATYSLQYIVSSSVELNRSFSRFIAEVIHQEIPEQLNYLCQASGEGKERPDIAAIDTEGKERILIEAKFYAGLTDNQPNAYLDRLAQKNGDGLVFICPQARKEVLWWHLQKLVFEREIVKCGDNCITVDSVRMAIVTWSEVLSVLKHTSVTVAKEFISDVEQLEGFCQQMDSEAFIPFSAEDLGSETARKEERYYRVIDTLIDKLKTDKSLNPSTKGVKATAYRKGYARAVRIRDYWVAVNYDRDLWMNTTLCDTPFWVVIRSGADWKQYDYILKAFQRIPEVDKGKLWGMTYLALQPMQNGTLDEIVIDLKSQILNYLDIIDQERSSSN